MIWVGVRCLHGMWFVLIRIFHTHTIMQLSEAQNTVQGGSEHKQYDKRRKTPGKVFAKESSQGGAQKGEVGPI